jgi:hypothetical protein
MKYIVLARKWRYLWELTIMKGEEEVGVTACRSLALAEDTVRDYLNLLSDVPDPDVQRLDIEVVPQLDTGLVDAVREVRQSILNAEQARDSAARYSRHVARKLKESGLSGADIAAVLRVSKQRVSQLLGAKSKVP